MVKAFVTALLAVILSTCLMQCKFGKGISNKGDANEFEGIITYHEKIWNRDSRFNCDDTVQLYYSAGNYVGVHSEVSSPFHMVKDYYFADKPLRLLLFSDSDTLRELPLNFPVEKLNDFKIKKLKNEILSKNCEEIDLAINFSEKDSTTYTDMSFAFSRNYLQVDKDHFKNWNLGFFNKVIDESGTYFLRMKTVHFDKSHKNILSSKIYEAISVKDQAIDPTMFEIDSSKIKWAR